MVYVDIQTDTGTEKQYPRIIIRKIFLIEEFNLITFILVGSLGRNLKIPLQSPEHLVNRRGDHLVLALVIFSVLIHLSPMCQYPPS